MKTKIFFLLLLSLYIVNCTLYITQATTRYVSKTGSSIPPYTSPETAADSIQKCINISQFGDTIYVANGIYKEQVIMIPGLALIGAGMDSCVIDTQELVTSQNYNSVIVADSCLLTGFHINVFNSSLWGRVNAAVAGGNGNNIVTGNKITNARNGIVPGLFTIVYKNIFSNVSTGADLINSNATIRNNIILLDPNSQATIVAGVSIEAFNSNYTPLIDSNYIEVDMDRGEGIEKGFGSSPIIRNNVIVKHLGNDVIFLSTSTHTEISNNTFICLDTFSRLIRNAGVTNLKFNNNHIFGGSSTSLISSSGQSDTIKNNVFSNTSGVVSFSNLQGLDYRYNDIWESDVFHNGFTPDTTNISVNPMVVNDDSTQRELDFHLQKYSPLIDAGDPAMIDKDSSRIDIGLYGGLFGEVYTYQDLAPRPPRNVIAVYDTVMIKVKWNRNTEADFSEYKLFRDTVADFTADSTTLVLSLTDTSYSHLTPPKVDAYYYKLTAVDNEGNESNVSDEIVVKLTAIGEYPMIVSDYRLYQNYPNPFNPSTTIGYRLKESGYVKLYVYDIKGEQIAVLVNQYQAGGYYEIEFDGRNLINQIPTGNLSSGVYIYQLMVKGENNIPVFSDIKKMLMIK